MLGSGSSFIIKSFNLSPEVVEAFCNAGEIIGIYSRVNITAEKGEILAMIDIFPLV